MFLNKLRGSGRDGWREGGEEGKGKRDTHTEKIIRNYENFHEE